MEYGDRLRRPVYDPNSTHEENVMNTRTQLAALIAAATIGMVGTVSAQGFDDPILAATQAAVLPTGRVTVEEGYIRITPDDEVEGG